jgi:hypothetical protein
MKAVFALAALAAIGFTGTALAEDGTWSSTRATAPKAMSDSAMDKVTAGDAGISTLIVTPRGSVNGNAIDHAPVFTTGVTTGGLPNSNASSWHGVATFTLQP